MKWVRAKEAKGIKKKKPYKQEIVAVLTQVFILMEVFNLFWSVNILIRKNKTPKTRKTV